MRLIPPGEFEMGPADGEVDRMRSAERTPRRVKLTHAYYLDECEVSNAQFEKFAQAKHYVTDNERTRRPDFTLGIQGSQVPQASVTWRTPFAFKNSTTWADECAVCISWKDATAYAKWAGVGLPTEAQFERAMSPSGKRTLYAWGDNLPPPSGIGNLNGEEGWTDTGSRASFSIKQFRDPWRHLAPVCSSSPNEWGLHNMVGNAAEWCQDFFSEEYDLASETVDPEGAPSGKFDRHVVRGVGWSYTSEALRRSTRVSFPADTGFWFTGFRLCKTMTYR